MSGSEAEVRTVPRAARDLQHRHHCAVCATVRSRHQGQATNQQLILSHVAVVSCDANTKENGTVQDRTKQTREDMMAESEVNVVTNKK